MERQKTDGKDQSSTGKMLVTMNSGQQQATEVSHHNVSQTKPKGMPGYRPAVEPVPDLNARAPDFGPLKYDAKRGMYYTGKNLDEIASGKKVAESSESSESSCNLM